MKTPVIFVIGLLLVSNVFWAASFFRERGLNQQTAEPAPKVQESVSVTHTEVSEEPTMQSVAGIYDLPNRSSNDEYSDTEIDLRSNGDCRERLQYRRNYTLNGIWSLSGKTATVSWSASGPETKYQIEGEDLIDPKGNRWLRLR